MQLFSRQFGAGPPVIILHGLFGSSDNWQTFGKKLSEQGYQVHALDLRNHGQSPHDPEFDYASLAGDVEGYIRYHHLQLPVVLGHSLGGKTTLRLALQHPALLAGMVIVDIAPRYYPVHHRSILDALHSVDFNTIRSRTDAEKILSAYIKEPAVLQFLMKNLWWKDKDQLAWRFNLEAISHNIENVGEAVYPDGFFHLPSLFVRGEKSNYISDADELEILDNFHGSEVKTAPGAGHWVHAENPSWLMDEVLTFLKKLQKH